MNGEQRAVEQQAVCWIFKRAFLGDALVEYNNGTKPKLCRVARTPDGSWVHVWRPFPGTDAEFVIPLNEPRTAPRMVFSFSGVLASGDGEIPYRVEYISGMCRSVAQVVLVKLALALALVLLGVFIGRLIS